MQVNLNDILKYMTSPGLIPIEESELARSAEFLSKSCLDEGRVIYGVNTGFGALCDTVIADADLAQLQENLIISHACGTGPEVDAEVVRAMMVLKVLSLGKGHSGVMPATVQRLLQMLEADVLPVVYEQGSLGASGDLAPLAHLSLPLIGRGMVRNKGVLQQASLALDEIGLQPLRLHMKEGLALLNGTQFMGAFGVLGVHNGMRISYLSDLITAMSLDAFQCRYEPFDALVGQVRPHRGHQVVAARIMENLRGSEIGRSAKKQVQDPYSFRCVPQVHGASLQALWHVQDVVLTEANAVSDNPLVFAEENRVISAGNFHGQPLALVLDYAAIALAELGSISERRTYQLISGQRGLPPFLAPEAGLNSGFMIPQYTAASIVSQNKQLCSPSSVDSIVSSNGQEDHVSMGANAATKLHRVVENVYQVLAIELITAAQALDLRRPAHSSDVVEHFHGSFRKEVPFLPNDAEMSPLLHRAKEFLRQWSVN
jgi:histidine ammonia-lyase